MKKSIGQETANQIMKKAVTLGIDLCGMARVRDLKTAPSFVLGPQMPDAGKGIGTRRGKAGLKPGDVSWPESAETVFVMAVAHPEKKPELDWWYGRKSPAGNRILMSAAKSLCEWITGTFDIKATQLPYHVEKGGIYLKDAAVMAGLGCIGKNNILLTPEYGPRIRLRALTLDVGLPVTGPSDFDPCEKCPAFCRRACPQNAFDRKVFNSQEYGLQYLPGRSGCFSRPTCNVQMQKDNQNAIPQRVDGYDEPVKLIKYCRLCELACPVGQSNHIIE